MGRAAKGNDRIPTIHFQVRFVSSGRVYYKILKKFQDGMVNNNRLWNRMIENVHPKKLLVTFGMCGTFESICQQKALTNDISILEWWWWLFKMMQMMTIMHKCMNAWMNEWMNERTNKWRNEWMKEWMNKWMHQYNIEHDHCGCGSCWPCCASPLVCVLAAVVLMLALRYHVAVSLAYLIRSPTKSSLNNLRHLGPGSSG